MGTLRRAALSAVLALLLAGLIAGGAIDVATAGQHVKTHPTAARMARRSHHHGSGNTSHQHHARHARTHGHRKHQNTKHNRNT